MSCRVKSWRVIVSVSCWAHPEEIRNPEHGSTFNRHGMLLWYYEVDEKDLKSQSHVSLDVDEIGGIGLVSATTWLSSDGHVR